MRKPVICHDNNAAFLDALESCLSTGLKVLLDGDEQTKEMLEVSFKSREPETWTGTILLNDKGDIEGLSFTVGS